MIYTVHRNIRYDGGHPCGVFSTKEKAEAYIAVQDDWHAQDMYIEEMVIDKPIFGKLQYEPHF